MKGFCVLIGVVVLLGLGYFYFGQGDDGMDEGVSSENVACTEEAKVCADGSVVVRGGRDCEFAACPSVGVCEEESRNVEECVEIYQPVCASVDVECFAAPCEGVLETYSNSCFACQNERVGSFVSGEC